MAENKPTLLLSESEVLSLLSLEAAFAASKEAFRLVGNSCMNLTHNPSMFVGEERVNLFGSMSVHWPEKNIAAFKWFNMFPRQQKGYPSMNGHVIVLSNTENGAPIAILAGTPITNYRTAAGHGAVAAKVLARKNSSVLAVIGCGSQGELGLFSLLSVLPIQRVVLWNHRPEKAIALTRRVMTQYPELPVITAKTPAKAVQEADVVLTATTACTPLLHGTDIPPGCTVIGLYSFNDIGKDMAAEVDRWFLGSIAADRKSILENKKLLARNALPDPALVSGELCSVICGGIPGRTDDSQRILYTHMGMAALDVTLGLRVYETAVSRGIGTRIHF